MTTLKTKFGKRLKEIRKSKHLTQEKVAELVGIETPNLSKIECGMHFPQPDKIEKLASALGVNVRELFDFEHFIEKEEMIKYISSSVKSFELKNIELVYKFVSNLKLYK